VVIIRVRNHYGTRLNNGATPMELVYSMAYGSDVVEVWISMDYYSDATAQSCIAQTQLYSFMSSLLQSVR